MSRGTAFGRNRLDPARSEGELVRSESELLRSRDESLWSGDKRVRLRSER
jgi:hypothetical protein